MKQRTFKLKEFAQDISVAVKDAQLSPLKRFVGLEHYDSNEPVITRFTDTSLLSSSVKEFSENDILIARRNVYLRRAGIVFFSGLTSGDSIVLRIYNDCEDRTGIPKDDAIRIIPFILNSNDFWAYANKHADGMNSKRISKDMLYDYEFSLPPIEEQRILSDKLWAAYRLKESYKKLLTATQEMVKSQFIEMFGDKGYPLAMIKSFADVSTGGTPSKAHPEYWNGNKPWVSAEDMKSKYVYDTCEKVTDAGFATCKIIPMDTLMYVCRGSIGVMAINKIECATNQSICRATCHDNVCNVEFLYHALMYKRDNIKKMGTGTSFKSLNQTTFSELEIELPPYDEQMKFVEIANQADKSEFVGFKSQFIEMFYGMETTPVKDYIDDSFPGEWGTEDKDGNGVKVIRTTNFTNSGKLNLADVVTRSIEDRKVARKQIKKYDTILERSGGTADNPVGRVVLFEEDDLFLCNNFTQVLRFKDVDPRFAFYALYYFYQTNRTAIRSMGSKTTGIQNLNMSKYLEIGIPNASDEGQKVFVTIAEQADKS